MHLLNNLYNLSLPHTLARWPHLLVCLCLTIISVSRSKQILSMVHAVVWCKIIAAPNCPFALSQNIIRRILIFRHLISCLMFSSLPARSMVLTFQHATLTVILLLPDAMIRLMTTWHALQHPLPNVTLPNGLAEVVSRCFPRAFWLGVPCLPIFA